MKKIHWLVLSSLIILGAIFSLSAQAAEVTPPAPQGPAVSVPVEIPGTVNCFDYYKFGSVQVDIQAETATTVPGVPLTLMGIKNDNDYPIVDGAVYVKVFKKQKDQDQAHSNGNYLVAQFVAKDNISLPAKAEQDISFAWQIPLYATAGDYQAATFFVSAKKFNLLGLSFTDDIVGNTFDFNINGENTENVQWDKNTVSINNNPYHFAAFIPKFTKDESVTLKTKLINTTKEIQAIPVTWTLYSWDGQQDKNILNTKSENITINPGETKEMEYQVTDNTQPVYYVVAEAKYHDTSSILDMRFGREGVDKVRLNFPAITSYPLKANTPTTLFTCLHNSGLSDKVDGNKLTLTLLDQDNNAIHTYNYTGTISGAMMGLKDDFTPTKDYSNFTLKAELYTGDKLMDEAEMKYDCQAIDAKTCPAEKTTATMEKTLKNNSGITLAIGLAIILLLISVGAIIMHKRKSNGMKIVLIATMIGAGMLFGNASNVSAASLVNSKNYSGTLWYTATVSGDSVVSPGLTNPLAEVHYNAAIYNADTNQLIAQNATISVGTRLRFEQLLGDVAFYGTGNNADTPMGDWIGGAAFPDGPTSTSIHAGYTFRDGQCSEKYKVTTIVGGMYDGISVYTPFSVNPPVQSVPRDGASQARLSCAGNICQVISVGSINTNFIFSDTFGYFYYEWSSKNFYPGCHTSWNLSSMISCNKVDWWGYCAEPVFTPVKIDFPAQTISYNLTAVTSGNPPAPPSITGPTTGLTNTPYTFTATATDPDGDTLRYGFDWDKNGTVDQWLPAAGYVASGTPQSAPYTWTTTGIKTIKVQACDNKGGCSGWGIATINIAANTNGACGNAQGSYTMSDTTWRTPACSTGTANPDPIITAFLTPNETKNWQCLGTGTGTTANCSATRSCVSNTCSGATTWSGNCNGTCGGGIGTESGACNNACGNPIIQSRACTNNTACPVAPIKWIEM